MNKTRSTTYALVGGLSAGPIVPLVSLWQEIKEQKINSQAIIIDLPSGVGLKIANQYKIPFVKLRTGKLRRYWSYRNVFTPFLVIYAFFRSLFILRKYKVDYVIGAGGFVQVPVMWAAYFSGIKIHLHQQDLVPSLANKLCLNIATTISVTFDESRHDFLQYSGLISKKDNNKTEPVWTGNPVRDELMRASRKEGQKFFTLDPSWPTLLVLGGGTGASYLNDLIIKSLPELVRTVQIIHSTGKRKYDRILDNPKYHSFEFIGRMDLALAASDIVVSRAGIGTISELAQLSKVSIIIPMPNSHQEVNAQLLYEKQAAIVLDQKEADPFTLISVIRKLLLDLNQQKLLKQNIRGLMPQRSAEKIAKILLTHDR